MALLFDIPEDIKNNKKDDGPKLKLKKGQTINTLIEDARRLVNEKLGKYKDTSICVTDINVVKNFFKEAKELVAIDTETTRIKYF